MSGSTKIPYVDAVWDPTRGCQHASEGCRHCWAEAMAKRFCGPGLPWEGFAEPGKGWTGKAALIPSALDWPLHRKKPLTIFVCSKSDLFHEALAFEAIAAVYGVMAACQRHTFITLTKRAARRREFYAEVDSVAGAGFGTRAERLGWLRTQAARYVPSLAGRDVHADGTDWPLPNVWEGVSCEDQATADERIPLLLATPAAHRWISAEPMLGPIDLRRWTFAEHGRRGIGAQPGISAVVTGGESGPHARPCSVEWVRSIRDQCRAAGVPCYVKQDSGGGQGKIPDDLWSVKELAWPLHKEAR